jgi:hypothetical protein
MRLDLPEIIRRSAEHREVAHRRAGTVEHALRRQRHDRMAERPGFPCHAGRHVSQPPERSRAPRQRAPRSAARAHGRSPPAPAARRAPASIPPLVPVETRMPGRASGRARRSPARPPQARRPCTGAPSPQAQSRRPPGRRRPTSPIAVDRAPAAATSRRRPPPRRRTRPRHVAFDTEIRDRRTTSARGLLTAPAPTAVASAARQSSGPRCARAAHRRSGRAGRPGPRSARPNPRAYALLDFRPRETTRRTPTDGLQASDPSCRRFAPVRGPTTASHGPRSRATLANRPPPTRSTTTPPRTRPRVNADDPDRVGPSAEPA